ncbi:MAG: rod shape-determining protein MreD [Deltaproteobacteria bacterium]|nr:rod shape-determining protein MreD [Deltaproteobacteria bacterium]
MILATTLMGFSPTYLPTPDVVLIVVIIFSFQYSFSLGGALSFLLGLLQDILSGGIIGLNALSKTVIFSLTKTIARRFYFSNVVSKIAIVFLAGIFDFLLAASILFIGGKIHSTVAVLARQLFLQIFFTGLFSPLVFLITPAISDLGERGSEEGFRYGHKKARTRGI